MTLKEAIEIIEVERACVKRNTDNKCDRDCINCDLLRTEEEIFAAYDMAIEALEKQIPKKPYTDNENGLYEKQYCPTCNRSLFPNDHHCICGQKLDWEE